MTISAIVLRALSIVKAMSVESSELRRRNCLTLWCTNRIVDSSSSTQRRHPQEANAEYTSFRSFDGFQTASPGVTLKPS